MKHQKSKCNCCECIWKRILINSNQHVFLTTKRGIEVTYKVENDFVVWMPISPNQNALYNQSKKQICDSLIARSLNHGPSQYPGTATSYKWALLNHPSIWL